MAEEIEKFIITIESDIGDLLEGANKGTQEVEKSLDKVEKKGKSAFGGAERGAKGFTATVQRLLRPIKILVTALKVLALAFTALAVVLKIFPSLGKKFGGRLGEITERGKKLSRVLAPLAGGIGKFISVLGIGSAAGGAISTFVVGIGAAATAIAALGVAAVAAVAVGLTLLAKKLISLGKASVTANTEFETVTAQFETLLGSAQAAEERIAELEKFGIETPFELPEIVEASRILQVFGGDVLATGDNLRMIGDIAAGVNRPFQEVAFWIGRMFDALQSGGPFGDAAARLQEMGALSGEARRELEKLQKEGATGEELWALFNEQVGSKFVGNMDRLAKTFVGVTSNLVDLRDRLIRIGGEELFDEVSDSAKEFLDIISDEEIGAVLDSLAKAIGKIAEKAAALASSALLDSIRDIDPENVERLSDSLEDMASALSEVIGTDITADINGLIQILSVLADTVTIVANTLNANRAIIGAVAAFTGIDFTGIDLPDLAPLADASRDLAEASQTEAQAAEELAEKLGDLRNKRKDVADSAGPVIESSQEIVDAFEAEKDALDSLGSEFIDLQENTGQKLQELNEDHAQKVEEINTRHQENLTEIAAEATRARKEARKKEGEALRQLAKDTARQRAKILDSARLELAKLEAATDRQLEEERETFEIKELRETEDHLQELRRLRNRFIDDLETAAKNRDARAIVDLRRRFQRDQQESQTGFRTTQQRERQDQDRRLAEIREAEQVRSAEIIAARERDLQNLIEAEAQKREEISRTLNEELVKIDEQEVQKVERETKAFEERVAREEEQFAKRQEELSSALKERLKAEAKALADQDEITEEGAKAILETLNKTFGIGGNIDKLMEDFANRRRQKFRITVEFEESVSEGPSTSSPSLPSGPGGPNPIPSFQEGGTLVARKPTLAMFGEAGPEIASFMPLDQMQRSATVKQTKRLEVDLNFRGSAPPGIRGAERDQIANVIIQAFRQAGVMQG